MDFTIKNLKNSITSIARSIGYLIIDTSGTGEYNMVRKLHLDNYPRFHIYAKQQGENFVISLHLDQKKPVYGLSGGHAHNGEYFGPIIDNEIDRIREILKSPV